MRTLIYLKSGAIMDVDLKRINVARNPLETVVEWANSEVRPGSASLAWVSADQIAGIVQFAPVIESPRPS